MKAAAILLFAVSVRCLAQGPEVPHKIHFAGMTLTIRDDARREIQKDVNMLTQSPKHFAVKVDRARTYFPIIEKIFEEERVPDDFKFLVIQESALIADAVSTSNAVGFWQFKDFTAIEMGLRVDKDIDERMNIAAASRAAAKYIKKNNFYFNNWLYALQAYQMGAGGVMQQVKDYESGTKHMEVTSRTYWYVKKYLAHKIAYEQALKGPAQIQLLIVENKERKSISDLAKEFAVNEDELRSYNKWARKDVIPGDRSYMVAIPNAGNSKALANAVALANERTITPYKKEPTKRIEPKVTSAKTPIVFVNGIPAVRANSGETVTALAKRAEVDISYFLRYNDISITDKVIPDAFYYIERKNTRSFKEQHVSTEGESLWSISQQYGVQLKKLSKYNKGITSSIKPGTLIKLTNRPVKEEVIHNDKPIVEINSNETFSWAIEQDQVETSTIPSIIASNISQHTPSTNVATPENVSPEPLKISADQHTVSAGETLYSIAKKYNVGVMDLVEWNTLKIGDGLRIGQVLKVKNIEVGSESEEKSSVQPAETVYEVKSSDTLYSVARKYGVTIKEIMDWNQKKDFSVVAGEKLRILPKL